MKVRIKKFPNKVLEVGLAEYTDLKRQGLLVPEPAPAAAAPEPVKEHKPRPANSPSDNKEVN